MSLLSDARQTLYAALSGVFDTPAVPQGAQFARGRVEAYPTQQVVAPCVWIDQNRGEETTIGTTHVARIDSATFPVVIVYDGADRAQVAGLDELVARVWDAARTVGHPSAWSPQPLDAGGPTLRATVVDVDMRVGASTLCGPSTLTQEVA